MSECPAERANIAQVKEHLSEYVTKAERGQKVIVCRRNEPVVELVPIQNQAVPNRTKLGSAKGSVEIKCDLTETAISADDWDALP